MTDTPDAPSASFSGRPAPPRIGAPGGGDQTRAIHAGEERPNGLRSITTPIACTTTYRFESMADAMAMVEGRSDADDYSRYSNPTLRTAERKIAALEGTDDCVLVSSGMAAISTTFLALLSAGQHVVLTRGCYRPTEEFFTKTLARLGIECTLVPPNDIPAIEAAIRPKITRAIFVESPSNPLQNVADFEALKRVKKAHRGVKLVVDATFASPFNQTPFADGADVVIQSATKFLGGHNDLMAGAVSGRSGIVGAIRDLRNQLGPVADPHAAYLLLRGIKTLPLRMQQHNNNAQAVAEFLEAHPKVSAVHYAGLPSHPTHALAKKYMRGMGGVLSFELRSDLPGVFRFCDACCLFQIGASLGGAESLLHPPAVFSYWDLAPEERAARGMVDGLVRLAIGLESSDDLIADLSQALEQV